MTLKPHLKDFKRADFEDYSIVGRLLRATSNDAIRHAIKKSATGALEVISQGVNIASYHLESATLKSYFRGQKGIELLF